MHSVRFFIPVIAAAALLAGCAQRSIPAVEQSGDWAMERQDYATAAAEYGEVVDRSPGRAHSRVGLGKALLELDQPAAARPHLEVAVQQRPNDPEVAELYAESMLGAGDVDAMRRFLRSRAENRATTDDYMRLGRFAARAGDVDEGERALKTAARLDRGMTTAPQLALADFYTSVGDNEAALERLSMALWIDPLSEDIQERIRAMGETPGPTFATRPSERIAATP